MNRRGILRFIAGAPLAGVAQEIAKAADMSSSLGNAISDNVLPSNHEVTEEDDRFYRAASLLRDKVYSSREPVMMPIAVEMKRSWSPVYKESIARQIRQEQQDTLSLIEKIMHDRSSSVTRLGMLHKLANKLGLSI